MSTLRRYALVTGLSFREVDAEAAYIIAGGPAGGIRRLTPAYLEARGGRPARWYWQRHGIWRKKYQCGADLRVKICHRGISRRIRRRRKSV